MHPTYPLSQVKQLVRSGSYRITRVALDYAASDFQFTEQEIVQTVLKLNLADFYKTMPSEQIIGLWQDVYKPLVNFKGHSTRAYVKLQITEQKAGNVAIFISFKKA